MCRQVKYSLSFPAALRACVECASIASTARQLTYSCQLPRRREAGEKIWTHNTDTLIVINIPKKTKIAGEQTWILNRKHDNQPVRSEMNLTGTAAHVGLLNLIPIKDRNCPAKISITLYLFNPFLSVERKMFWISKHKSLSVWQRRDTSLPCNASSCWNRCRLLIKTL